MAFYIKDRIYVQVIINNVEVPLDKLNMLKHIHIVESVRVYLPMLTMTLTDATKFLSKNNLLTDGALISIGIGIEKIKRVYEFRKFNHKESLSEGGTDYIITGYLNAPKFWAASTFEPMKGTSSEVIKKIAGMCDLTFEGVTTADTQLWMPYNTKFCEFARQISERAWVNSSSCVQIAVTAQKKLRMVDLSDDTRKPRESFSNKGDSVSSFPVIDYNMLTKSGFYNSVSGYQDTTIGQTILEQSDKKFTQVDVKRNSKKISISTDVKNQVKQSRVNYAPIDVGNVSKTYVQAKYQNRRLSNLYSFGAEFTTPHFLESDILDQTLCEFAKTDVAGVQEISGIFTITSKVTYLEGMNFSQKLEVYRHGPNSLNDSLEL